MRRDGARLSASSENSPAATSRALPQPSVDKKQHGARINIRERQSAAEPRLVIGARLWFKAACAD
jgi:hypothetical protein